jgi:PAS domain S-box-containing protein
MISSRLGVALMAAVALLLALLTYLMTTRRERAQSSRDMGAALLAERKSAQLAAELEAQVAQRTAELEGTRRTLQTVLDSMPAMVGRWNRDLVNEFANRAYGSWMGVEPRQALGRHMRELFGAEVLEVSWPYIEGALRGEPQSYERELPRSDGAGVRHCIVHYVPDVVDGKVAGFYTLAFDISELAQSRARLAASERENTELLRTINLHSIVAISDRHGRILDVNDSFCRASGYAREELIGQNLRIVSSGVHDREFWLSMWRTLHSGQPWRGEICYRGKDGALDWVDSIVAPFMGDDGRIRKYISLGTSVTARNRKETELRRSNSELEQFAYVASHDLQEPLRMVASYTELLAQRYRGKLDERADKYIYYAVDGAKRMQQLVSDLLAYSRIGSQGRPLVPVSSDEVLRRVMQGLRKPLTDTHAIVEANALPMVLADEGQLGQLFQNLISNALKFRSDSPPRVVIDASRTRDRWTFSVRDNGIGFDMQFAEKIFLMFQRLHERGKYEGSGIGLSIVKRIVDRHGGQLRVESAPGKGSTFFFTLKAA